PGRQRRGDNDAEESGRHDQQGYPVLLRKYLLVMAVHGALLVALLAARPLNTVIVLLGPMMVMMLKRMNQLCSPCRPDRHGPVRSGTHEFEQVVEYLYVQHGLPCGAPHQANRALVEAPGISRHHCLTHSGALLSQRSGFGTACRRLLTRARPSLHG